VSERERERVRERDAMAHLQTHSPDGPGISLESRTGFLHFLPAPSCYPPPCCPTCYMYIYMYIYMYMHIYMYIYMHIYMHMYM